MIAEERRKVILEKIRIEKAVSVQELARLLDTTVVTIRRDLDLLDKQGLVIRSHGGAIINEEKVGYEFRFDTRKDYSQDIKAKIGQKAAGFVTAGDCIGIDVGTTAYEMSRYLKNVKGLNVVTASLPVVNELLNCGDINIICTGGEVSRRDKSLIGHNAVRTLKEYILDKAFIGVAGISFDCGFTLFNMNDALVKRVLVERAKEVIILADATKIGAARHAFFCELETADKLITDKRITQEDKSLLESHGIEVIIADEED
ncbi:MAG: DeoR/GlpR transcriptional regulator [Lachnospiraceae bacterium]|nr:DeoR/GlpR transcriptional regulator [Lachnospiraceae bacterium]